VTPAVPFPLFTLPWLSRLTIQPVHRENRYAYLRFTRCGLSPCTFAGSLSNAQSQRNRTRFKYSLLLFCGWVLRDHPTSSSRVCSTAPSPRYPRTPIPRSLRSTASVQAARARHLRIVTQNSVFETDNHTPPSHGSTSTLTHDNSTTDVTTTPKHFSIDGQMAHKSTQSDKVLHAPRFTKRESARV